MEPLPLDAAHVIAAGIVRYRADGGAANPIVEAARSKLAHPLQLRDRLPRKRH